MLVETTNFDKGERITPSSKDFLCSDKQGFLLSQVDITKQALNLLHTIDNDGYQYVCKPYVTSSIGQHMRHILDHYLALKQGLQTNTIDYEMRNRFSQVETQTHEAASLLAGIVKWLDGLSENELATKLMIISDCTMTKPTNAKINSTLGRELLYVSSHCIHHFSLISIICKLQNIAIPEDFGVAPATLAFKRLQKGAQQ